MTGSVMSHAPLEAGSPLRTPPAAAVAGIIFSVLRDRVGAREDRFFATVFLGSGLLFVGMLFPLAAGFPAVTSRC